LFEFMNGIAIGGQFIVAVKNGNGVFLHPFNKSFPVLNKYFRIKWQVFHADFLEVAIYG